MPFTAPESDLVEAPGFSAPEKDLADAPEQPELAPESGLKTAGREFASKIFPAVATGVAGTAAGLAAAETGPGAIVADVLAGGAAGAATEKGQETLMGKEWSAENMRQMEANAKAHPTWAMVGGALPFIFSAAGGGRGLAKKAGQEAEALAKSSGLGATEQAAARLKASQAKDASAIASATGFGRAQGAAEAEQQVETGEFKPGQLAGQTALGAATGGAMHFIPGDVPKFLAGRDDLPAMDKLVRNALWRVTGKAAGDATVMVTAQKAYDAITEGKPFSLSDVAGGSAAATLDFALLNALHAGIDLHRASRQAAVSGMPELHKTLQNELDNFLETPPADEEAPEETPGPKPRAEMSPAESKAYGDQHAVDVQAERDAGGSTIPATIPDHRAEIAKALQEGKPVNAEAYDEFAKDDHPDYPGRKGLEMPGGYERDGDVYRKKEAPKAAKNVPRGTIEPEHPEIVAATFTAPDGKVTEGDAHVDAAKEAGVNAPTDPQSRETPEYSFKVQDPDGSTRIVSREEALEIARKNGQLKKEADTSNGRLHSDQIEMGQESRWQDVPVTGSNRPAFESLKEAREAHASADPVNGGIHDIGKPESLREYLLRLLCRGYTV